MADEHSKGEAKRRVDLDAGIREQIRFANLQLQRAVGIASIYVTHDQTEAM